MSIVYRVYCFLGVVAVVVAWIVIGVSWALNSWFVFIEHAFSDLGGASACCPYVYNYGLIIVGILVFSWSIFLYMVAENKLETIGAGYVALMGVFLSLIGLFPSGTSPHVFVSSWFFIQSNLAFILLGAGIARRSSRWGKALLTIELLAFPIAGLIQVVIDWPSAAVIEAYGIIIIDIGVILTTLEYCKRDHRYNRLTLKIV